MDEKRTALIELKKNDWETDSREIIFGQHKDEVITDKTVFRTGKIISGKELQDKKHAFPELKKEKGRKKVFALPLTNVKDSEFQEWMPVKKFKILQHIGSMMEICKRQKKTEEFYLWLLLASIIEKGDFDEN